MGSVADLRRLVPQQHRNSYGMLICYLTLVLDRPEHCDLLTVVRRVAKLTDAMKRNHSYLANLLTIRLALLMGQHLKSKSVLKHPIKNFPMCGGASSFRITTQMIPSPALKGVLGYVRAVSTGPHIPLVVQASKLGDGASFGFCFRPTAVPRQTAAHAADEFVDELMSVAD